MELCSHSLPSCQLLSERPVRPKCFARLQHATGAQCSLSYQRRAPSQPDKLHSSSGPHSSRRSSSSSRKKHIPESLERTAGALLAACAACWLSQAAPALAELQTAAPSAVTEMAKPLKSQPVNKNKIWLLFGAGAAGVFGTAVLLENNERLFPAIAKANKAMRMAQQMRESEASAEEPPIDTSTAEPQEDPSQSAFAAGLKEASQKARAQSPPSAIADAASQPQPDESTDSSKESRAELSHDAQETQQNSQQSRKQLQPKG